VSVAEVPPQPVPDADTEGFWRATARGEMALGRCGDCRRWQHPPVERCRVCEGLTAFEPISGAGHIFSFIVVHRASVPGFAGVLPYVVALVELDEQPGLRLVSRLVGVEPDAVAIGGRVQGEIEDLPGGPYRVPVFRPVI
jgi:uncharacterized OB-fold protein